MNGVSALVIFIGAGVGALLRWVLSLALNPVFPTVPLGTLAANVVGGFLMGVAMGVFAAAETLPPAVRLAATTGFLGGLTTFSTFSAETVTLLLRKELAWSCALVGAHVGGSLLATLCGIGVTRLILQSSH
ncbi:fluoride efflux transporter CrcB [Dokdonella ginsengisoli]|uniref:Fluoride-specific ion channel FluC n=1 Tax=Dokdonella ginsengisoli TaxID=363846 RepID=A0ABV9QZY4_9GAMM